MPGHSGYPSGSMYNTTRSTATSRSNGRQHKPRPPNVALPVDSDDYLVPSPQSPPPATPNTINNNKNPYMDLISDGKSGMFVYPPPYPYMPGRLQYTFNILHRDTLQLISLFSYLKIYHFQSLVHYIVSYVFCSIDKEGF